MCVWDPEFIFSEIDIIETVQLCPVGDWNPFITISYIRKC